jgi:hypothetical protein
MEAHRLSLTNASDAWYAGGGAFNNGPGFGFAARPGEGSRALADEVDLSADYLINARTSVSFLLGCAAGGAVIDSIYSGSRATHGLIEVNHRW